MGPKTAEVLIAEIGVDRWIARRRGHKKAIVAVSHSILVVHNLLTKQTK